MLCRSLIVRSSSASRRSPRRGKVVVPSFCRLDADRCSLWGHYHDSASSSGLRPDDERASPAAPAVTRSWIYGAKLEVLARGDEGCDEIRSVGNVYRDVKQGEATKLRGTRVQDVDLDSGAPQLRHPSLFHVTVDVSDASDLAVSSTARASSNITGESSNDHWRPEIHYLASCLLLDSKRLLVCTGCIVSIFSVSTGMQIMELEGGHTDCTSVVVVRVAAPSISVHSMVIPSLSTIGSTEEGSNLYACFSVEDKQTSWFDEIKKIKLHHTKKMTCLAFHATLRMVAGGDDTGRILMWYNFGREKFAQNLQNLKGTKNPSDEAKPGVFCLDNHIHLLKMPTMDISKSISGIKPPLSFPLKHEGSCTQVAFEQTTGLVAVSTEDYCVQFYSLFDNHEVSELYVALVAISLDGSLMATIDVEEKLGGLVCLKYWSRGSLVAEYLLSTVIYEPHSDAQVSSLAFRPGHNMAVTSSYGGDFKVVSIRLFSFCCPVGKTINSCCFFCRWISPAIAAETMITLWDPDSNILVAMIGDTFSPITKLSFVGKSEYLVSYTHGLKPQLSVWSTSNLALYWSHGIVTEAISCSHDESQFTLLALLSSPGDADAKGNGVIFFFHVEDPVPVATWTVTKYDSFDVWIEEFNVALLFPSIQAKGGSLAFLPANPSLHESSATNGVNQLLLVFMNGEHEYTIFNPHKEEDIISKNSWKSQAAQDEAERFGYTSIYGDLSNSNAKHNHFQEVPFVPSERPWETIFSGSSHVLPPLTKLCTSFFESLLEKRLENSNEMIIDADL
ncbi:hypothetical protein ZIOFF_055969 [Zingiber officinale]|uniref:WD repeat-containing protein 75 second beta-propeller domain-containing protein n=1 Tax=Zingiber officinale TaxID=94328 RepID=A0A8J5KKR2_ZINOF|nr:hypothetical protein ZIOFF_055969 [Zingiber officinale]